MNPIFVKAVCFRDRKQMLAQFICSYRTCPAVQRFTNRGGEAQTEEQICPRAENAGQKQVLNPLLHG